MIKGLHHTSITVDGLEGSIGFYRDILGLELLFTQESSGEELSNALA